MLLKINKRILVDVTVLVSPYRRPIDFASATHYIIQH